MATFNTLAITKAANRLCENRKCVHTLQEHRNGDCEKCECQKFEINEFTIHIMNDNVVISFPNFIERKCTSCGEKTHMLMSINDNDDGFIEFSSVNTFHSSSVKTACHVCGKCGLVSFYKVTSNFERWLRNIKSRAINNKK